MESGAMCAAPKAIEILAVVKENFFELMPLKSHARCMTQSVAALTLYEKTHLDVFLDPGCALYLDSTDHE